MPDYQQLERFAEQGDAALGAINAAAVDLIATGRFTDTDLKPLLAPLGEASERIADIAAWGRKAVVEPKAGAPVEQVLPRLTGPAARMVLTMNGILVDGQYAIPGIDDQNVAREYINLYHHTKYYNPALITLAGMSDAQLAKTLADYATPADWMNGQRLRPEFIATLPSDWPGVLALAGR